MTENTKEIQVENTENQIKKEKKVGMSFFKQKAKDVNRLEKFYLDEERTQYIEYYPEFSRDRRDKIVQEFIRTIGETMEEGIDFLLDPNNQDLYANFLVIKHFVPFVGKQLEEKDFATHLEVLNTLYQTDYLSIFINEMFHVEELSKLNNQLMIAVNRLQKVEQELLRIQEENKKNGLKNVAVKSQKGK